ncbi:MAG: fumarate hydratase [Nanoarchaeota archaeon]
MELKNALVELYTKCATDLPKDIEQELVKALRVESSDSLAFETITRILDNVRVARKNKIPICQVTFTPIFYVTYTKDTSPKYIKDAIIEATKEATEKIPLRPNAVDPITGENSKNNVGEGYPIIYFREGEEKRIDLMLKGGGSENIGQVYKLPDERLKAGRDIEGIRRCVLDAMVKAQGKGCSPNYIGVAIGGSKDIVSRFSKWQIMRKVDDENRDPNLAKFEKLLKEELNQLGIGPLGLGGKTTCLGVKMTKTHRHPASFFVDVSFSCWATRRYSLHMDSGKIE